MQTINKILDKFQEFGIKNHQYPNAIGMWTCEQKSLLWACLHSNPDYNWLEIGSFYGGSAVLMCLAHHALGGIGKIISMDRKFDPMYYRNIEFGNFGDLIKQIECDSLNFDKNYNEGELSFALIDGWHSFKGAYLDFKSVDKYMINGGHICFHDVDMFESQDEIEGFYKKAQKNYDYFMSEPLPNDDINAQSFHLEELVAFIIKEHNYQLIVPDNIEGPKRPKEHWKPGISENNSLCILRKTDA